MRARLHVRAQGETFSEPDLSRIIFRFTNSEYICVYLCNHECQHAQHITDSYIQLFMHMKCMIISIFLFAHIHA